MISTTTGCLPEMVGEARIMGHLDAILWHLQYGTLGYVGFDVLEPFVCWSTRYKDDAQRQIYLNLMANRIHALDSIPVIPTHQVEDFGSDWRLRPGIEPRTIGHCHKSQ